MYTNLKLYLGRLHTFPLYFFHLHSFSGLTNWPIWHHCDRQTILFQKSNVIQVVCNLTLSSISYCFLIKIIPIWDPKCIFLIGEQINKHQSEAEGQSWLIWETAYLAPWAKGCSPIQGLHYASTMGKLIYEYAKHKFVPKKLQVSETLGQEGVGLQRGRGIP